ncbi:ABC transporter ATP-binding protein [Flavihumibacter sediminis]|nr:ABC transporter ATP-binding protein [Flavihumibacter sediminis]
MSKIAIAVENLSKLYRLGEIGTGTISHDLNRWWARFRGNEDPYHRLGEENKRDSKGSEWVWALKDVSFNVKQGEVLGIIGKNGAGKSTLLKLLSRVTAPTTGSIKAKGRIASLLEVGTGFHPELTGRDNIFLNGAILGMTRKEVSRKFDEIVAFSGVERYIDTPVKRYSSGMYVRLAFAVAAHLETEILIVDEVLAVGDAEFQKKCLGKMGEVSNKEGRTVLFVSHQMGVISQLCKSSILMANGLLSMYDNTSQVINKYISNQKSLIGNKYVADVLKTGLKAIYFQEIEVLNNRNELIDQLGFGESIFIKMNIKVNKYYSGQFIGIGLQDKFNNRITTFQKPLAEFYNNNADIELSIEIPGGFIAPNQYSFVFALFEPNQRVIDVVENVCSIRIIDTGSEFSIFEGVDYGSVILDSKWILN